MLLLPVRHPTFTIFTFYSVQSFVCFLLVQWARHQNIRVRVQWNLVECSSVGQGRGDLFFVFRHHVSVDSWYVRRRCRISLAQGSFFSTGLTHFCQNWLTATFGNRFPQTASFSRHQICYVKYLDEAEKNNTSSSLNNEDAVCPCPLEQHGKRFLIWHPYQQDDIICLCLPKLLQITVMWQCSG